MNSEILVQIGRVVYINYGSESQKLAVVRDFINTKKIIIDTPNGEVKRQVISIKRVEPTRYLLKGFSKDSDIASFKDQFGKASELFFKSGRGKAIKKQQLRKNLSDFDRFKVMVLRRRLSKAIRTQLNLKKSN